MIVIPAIDLHEGQVVRLRQGAFDDVTVYGDDPASVARSFVEAGARRIHVVDLDGSVEGRSVNENAIRAICEAVDVEVDLGGGIRCLADAQRLLNLGLSYVILGTMVVKDPEGAREIIRAFPGKVGLGIDARDGYVAIHGWKEITDLSVTELLHRYDDVEPAFVVYTDISRDGMLSGANVEATADLARSTTIPVIASGGVADIENLEELAATGVIAGAITGKAVYEGTLDLAEAVKRVQD